MDFAALPPEINSARMYGGVGSGPMLAAASAWSALAAELNSAATTYQTMITRLTGEEWMGPASAAMAAAAKPYAGWMLTTAAQAERTATQARTAAAAYEQAHAMTVPPPAISANRAQLQSLLRTNILGQNAPAIASTDAQYGEMWAQDGMAMHTYAAQSAQAAKLEHFSPPPQTVNPAGQASQAGAVAQAAGNTAAAKTLTATPKALQMLAAQGASAPTTSTSASSGGLSGIFDNPALSEFHSSYANFIHTANFGARSICAVWRGTSGALGAAKLAGVGATAASGAAGAAGGAAAGGAAAGGAASGLGGLGGVAGAMGQAGSVGGLSSGLSVPQSWAPPAPLAEPLGPVSGGTWEPIGGVAGKLDHGVPGVPGVPGAAGPAAMAAGGGRGAGAGVPPRYGSKLTVMPPAPFLG